MLLTQSGTISIMRGQSWDFSVGPRIISMCQSSLVSYATYLWEDLFKYACK